MNFRLMFSGFLLMSVSFGSVSQNPDIFKSDAIRFEWEKAYEKAASLYEKAALVYEEGGKIDTLCFFKAGQNYVRVKKYSEAIPFLKRVVEMGDAGQEVWLGLADALSGTGRYDEAQNVLDEGLTKLPDEARSLYKKKADLAYKNGKTDEALGFVDKALALGETKTLWRLKGNILEHSGHIHDAIAVYRKLIERTPGDEAMKLKLGFLLFKATDKDYKAEKARYTRLSNPSRVDYSYSRKKLEKIAQGYKEVIPILEAALKKRPKDTSIMKCLYVCYNRMGNKAKEAEYKNKLGL